MLYGNLLASEVDFSTQCYNTRSLEARRIGSIDHRLPHHMYLVNGFRTYHECDGDGDFHCFGIQIVRGLFVHLHKACGLLAGFVEYFYTLLEFEERCWINLAQFALGWSQPSHKGSLRVSLEELRRAGTEELCYGVQLLMNFETHFQTDFGIIHTHADSS